LGKADCGKYHIFYADLAYTKIIKDDRELHIMAPRYQSKVKILLSVVEIYLSSD
jgi:hypothetical protein